MSSAPSPGEAVNQALKKETDVSVPDSSRIEVLTGQINDSNIEEFLSQYDAKLWQIESCISVLEKSGISHDKIKNECHALFHILLDKVTRLDTETSELHGIWANNEFLSRVFTISYAAVMARRGCTLKEALLPLIEGLDITEVKMFKSVKVLKHCIKDTNSDEQVELVKIETSILQHLLWSSKSSIWGYLTKAETFLPVPSYEEANKSQVKGKKETAKVELSIPRSEDAKADDDIAGETNLAKYDFVGCDVTSETKDVAFIFRQVYNYSFSRLERLCRVLQVSTHLQDMWNGLNYALTKHCARLLWKRQLDIIILCLLYGVVKAKVPSNPLGFKQILHCYKELPNADPNIHEHIPLIQPVPNLHEVGKGDESSVSKCPPFTKKKSGNLVDFYNHIFLPNMKPFFASDVNPSTPDTPKSYSPMPGSYNSPVRVASNVYISPLREPLPSSPRSLEYKFPGTSQANSGLRDINEMLKKASPAAKRQSMRGGSPKPKSAKSITFGGERREVVVVPSSLPR